MKKLIVLVFMIAMMLSMVIGCSPADEPKEAKAPKEEKSSDAKDEVSEAGLPYEGVTITLMTDNNNSTEGVEAVAALAKEKLGIEVDIEVYVGGAEGDNIVKTRLASGEMSDILQYNSGSLLSALNPSDYFLDITDQPFMDRLVESFISTVSVDDVAYGIPYTTIMSGGFIYNKAIYSELGLEVPNTWDEFLKNCDVIKDAGKTAVIGTYGDSWTSQVIFLGDNYNVLAETPDFATKFEAGDMKFATNDAGVKSFQKLIDVEQYLNEDYSVATFDNGVDMLASGEGAHWAMLSFALSNVNELYPEANEDMGIFGIPGDSADDLGLTIWMPNALYINKDSESADAVLAFFDLYLSNEGLDAYTEAISPTGAYAVKGYELPDNTISAIKDDMQSYVNNGKTAPALEFMTAVKGPNCPAICTEAGSAQTSAVEAADAYDADCMKQAVQLGLNW